MLLVFLKYEAGYACNLPHFLKYDADSAAILFCETDSPGFLRVLPLYSAAIPFVTFGVQWILPQIWRHTLPVTRPIGRVTTGHWTRHYR